MEKDNANYDMDAYKIHTSEQDNTVATQGKVISSTTCSPKTRNLLKRLYYWVLHWAYTPYGVWALIFTAFSESSFFPIAPDVLLIPLSLSRPKKALWYATLCSAFSLLGGMLGYAIGLWFMDAIGTRLLELYGAVEQFQKISILYNRYSGIAVATAGFTPIPYKVFTIAAGACRINFAVFVIASAISRSARFFIVAILITIFGEKIKTFIDKYFNWVTLAFMILLIGGFLIVRFVVSK